MKNFIKSTKAEILKQHRNYFHSKIIYVSLFVWPMISFISAYYGFKPFKIKIDAVPYLNERNLIVFILLGYISLSFFQSLVQSAWRFSAERDFGTLELIYLTPANRASVILGNALSSLFESVWVMVVFSSAILILKYSCFNINILSALVVTVFMILMAIMWGMLLNSLFLFSRDSAFLFTVLEEPMELFSGVKVPTIVFPLWAKAISVVFPLTYAVEGMRRAFLGNASLYELGDFVMISTSLVVIMFILIIVLLKLGEKHAKRTGNMTLF